MGDAADSGPKQNPAKWPTGLAIALLLMGIIFAGLEMIRFHSQRNTRLELARDGQTMILVVDQMQALEEGYFVKIRTDFEPQFSKNFRISARDYEEKIRVGQKIRVIYPKGELQDFIMADIDEYSGFPVELAEIIFLACIIFLTWILVSRRKVLF